MLKCKQLHFNINKQDEWLIFLNKNDVFILNYIQMYNTCIRILPMVTLENLPMEPLVANGTIGNQRTLNLSR